MFRSEVNALKEYTENAKLRMKKEKAPQNNDTGAFDTTILDNIVKKQTKMVEVK